MNVRVATEAEIALADGILPLDRLDQPGPCLWLVAWDGRTPVGHVRVALDDPPELQKRGSRPRAARAHAEDDRPAQP